MHFCSFHGSPGLQQHVKGQVLSTQHKVPQFSQKQVPPPATALPQPVESPHDGASLPHESFDSQPQPEAAGASDFSSFFSSVAGGVASFGFSASAKYAAIVPRM